MTCVAFIGAFLFLWINIRQAARNSFALAEAEYDRPNKAGSHGKSHVIEIQGIAVSRDAVMRLMAFAVVGVAAVFALGFYTQWDTYLRFRYGGSFDVADPVFGVDVGYYVFRLPFYLLLQGSLVFLTVLAIIGVVSPYAYFTLMRMKRGRQIGLPHQKWALVSGGWC